MRGRTNKEMKIDPTPRSNKEALDAYEGVKLRMMIHIKNFINNRIIWEKP